MNPITFREAKKIFLDIKNTANKLLNIHIIICPPFLYLNELSALYKRHRMSVGAQNIFYKDSGFFTGMVSASMLRGNNIKYVILGHSEARSLGEDDDVINQKVQISLKKGLRVILCVGEKERDEDGNHFNFLKDQILNSLKGVSLKSLENIFVAYEPVWAISGKNGSSPMSSNDLYEMAIFIKKILSDNYKIKNLGVNILYGGSVNPRNAKKLMEDGGVNGLLVGKASLNSKKFNEILKIANNF